MVRKTSKHRNAKQIKTRKRYKRKDSSHHKAFKNVQCAPKNGDKSLDFTCYSSRGLEHLKKLWNARHPDRHISSNDSREIWSELKMYMKDCCNNEKDWLRHNFAKHNLSRELLDYTFAPDSPEEWKRKPTEWLTSIDILNVMKQYEHAYKDFDFIGPSPIDYDTHKVFGECVWEELCHFNLKSHMKRNIKHIGIIFNLDPHYKEGSHWVALFISIKKGCICFFDSYGEKPDPQIQKFMDTVQRQGSELGLSLHQHWIQKRHQYGNSECGMYSLYFIINMLKDKNVEYFQTQPIPDKAMVSMRKKYFNG